MKMALGCFFMLTLDAHFQRQNRSHDQNWCSVFGNFDHVTSLTLESSVKAELSLSSSVFNHVTSLTLESSVESQHENVALLVKIILVLQYLYVLQDICKNCSHFKRSVVVRESFVPVEYFRLIKIYVRLTLSSPSLTLRKQEKVRIRVGSRIR